MKLCFVSNYINHHQIPFCREMVRHLGTDFLFIQTMEMELERKDMGWGLNELPDYVKCFYEQPKECQKWIDDSDVVLFGGIADESYISGRLKEKKPVVRVDERMYKEGQWKAISPRGLLKKYRDHTSHRKDPVYFLCAGGYVASDLEIIKAYPGKKLCWGYFPPVKHLDAQQLLSNKNKEVPQILWAARMIGWKHPELPIYGAKVLKENHIPFHLTMIGGGILETWVKEKIREYDLGQEVTLLGYQPPETVREYMEASDIFLMTGDRREGWGAVANEAMNSCCAVLADVNTGAAPFLIRQGENGMLYDTGNRKLFADRLLTLARDGALRQRLGQEAYRTIAETWNAEYAASALLKVIETTVMKNKPIYASSQKPVFAPGLAAPVISERKMKKLLLGKQ